MLNNLSESHPNQSSEPITPSPQPIGLIEPTTPLDEQLDGSDRFFTIPTSLMTLPRIGLSIAIPTLAIMGKKTSALTIGGVISDKESWVATATDKLLPDKHLGKSKAGAELDYMADFTFGVGNIVAALATKRTPKTAKAAALLGAFKQARQGQWAASANADFKRKTGQKLKTKVTMPGKIATATFMASSGLNTLVRDMKAETPRQKKVRTILSLSSLALAGTSVVLGHISTRQNEAQRQEKLAEFIKTQNSTNNNAV